MTLILPTSARKIEHTFLKEAAPFLEKNCNIIANSITGVRFKTFYTKPNKLKNKER